MNRLRISATTLVALLTVAPFSMTAQELTPEQEAQLQQLREQMAKKNQQAATPSQGSLLTTSPTTEAATTAPSTNSAPSNVTDTEADTHYVLVQGQNPPLAASVPSPPTSSAGSDAPSTHATDWYFPRAGTDPSPVTIQPPPTPPTPQIRPKRRYAALGTDLYFHSTKMNNTGLSGAGSNLVARVGRDVGAAIGIAAPGPHFYLAFDLFRNSAKPLIQKQAFGLWLLAPSVAMELVFVDGVDKFSLGVGASATGLRATICTGTVPIFADWRAITTHLFSSLGDQGKKDLFAFALGTSIDIGVAF